MKIAHPHFICTLIITAALCGCDINASRNDDLPPPPQPAPSPWRGDESAMIAIVPGLSGEIDEELTDAIAHARATADEAREKWSQTGASLRTRWAVKWEARTTDGHVEYLWVQPVHWSPFRIEGLLASTPASELDLDLREQPALGDLVSFPIEELADWVHYIEGRPEGEREGGFTIDVLEERYGRPRSRRPH